MAACLRCELDTQAAVQARYSTTTFLTEFMCVPHLAIAPCLHVLLFLHGADYEIPPKTQELKNLIASAQALKGILSGIPDQIEDRTQFLSIIRNIASAIKNVLDSINAVSTENAALVKSQKNNLETNKKKFVRGSKTFSDTLKAFFKDGK